jgi:hypothetical protein
MTSIFTQFRLATVLALFATANGSCSVRPWLDVFSHIPSLSDSLSDGLSTDPECVAYHPADNLVLLMNAQIVLSAFPTHVQDALRFKLAGHDQLVLNVEEPSLVGLILENLPRVLVILPTTEPTAFHSDLLARDEVFKLSGTIEGDEKGQWAHMVNPDGPAPIDKHTQFLIYQKSGYVPWSVQPLAEVLGTLRKVRESSTPLERPRMSAEFADRSLSFSLKVSSAEFLEENKSVLGEGLVDWVAFNPDSVYLLYTMTSYQLFPDILVLGVTEPEAEPSRNFPLIFQARGKCMRLRGSIQSDDRMIWARIINDDSSWSESETVGEGYPIDANTCLVVYEHDPVCDLTVADQSALVLACQTDLIAALTEAKANIKLL